jgi:hypothetical protein
MMTLMMAAGGSPRVRGCVEALPMSRSSQTRDSQGHQPQGAGPKNHQGGECRWHSPRQRQQSVSHMAPMVESQGRVQLSRGSTQLEQVQRQAFDAFESVLGLWKILS